MVDNFKKIKELIQLQKGEHFYFIQIIQRKKENPEIGSNNNIIKTYYVDNEKTFDSLEGEIKKMCECFNARAYMHITPRSYRRIYHLLNEHVNNLSKNNQLRDIVNVFNSVCGDKESFENKNKTWIIDVDEKNLQLIDEITEFVSNLNNKTTSVVLSVLDTVNGYHMITKGFNSLEFKKKYPKIDLHKNNPTILYFK